MFQWQGKEPKTIRSTRLTHLKQIILDSFKKKLSGAILVISMESANTPAASENLDTMNLTNNQEELKTTATNEQKQTVEVFQTVFESML